MKINSIPTLILTLLLSGLSSSHAATFVDIDTALTTGSSAINPYNDSLTIPGNATSVATMESLSSFATIQDFSGFDGDSLATTNEYIFSFSDVSRADLRISMSGTVATGSNPYINNVVFQTSAGGAFRFGLNSPAVANSVTYRIDLGDYNSGSGVFTAGAEVQALGFTLTGRFWQATDDQVLVQYFDVDDNLLSSQSIVNSSTDSKPGYTALNATGVPIAYVTLSVTGGADATQAVVFGLDDLGMTAVIPEPSSSAAMGAVLICLFAYLACRHQQKA